MISTQADLRADGDGTREITKLNFAMDGVVSYGATGIRPNPVQRHVVTETAFLTG